jgi:hypothetical protein
MPCDSFAEYTGICGCSHFAINIIALVAIFQVRPVLVKADPALAWKHEVTSDT